MLPRAFCSRQDSGVVLLNALAYEPLRMDGAGIIESITRSSNTGTGDDGFVSQQEFHGQAVFPFYGLSLFMLFSFSFFCSSFLAFFVCFVFFLLLSFSPFRSLLLRFVISANQFPLDAPRQDYLCFCHSTQHGAVAAEELFGQQKRVVRASL